MTITEFILIFDSVCYVHVYAYMCIRGGQRLYLYVYMWRPEVSVQCLSLPLSMFKAVSC